MKIKIDIDCQIPNSLCGCSKCNGQMSQHDLPLNNILLDCPNDNILDIMSKEISYDYSLEIQEQIEKLRYVLLLTWCNSILTNNKRGIHTEWTLECSDEIDITLLSKILIEFFGKRADNLVPSTSKGGPGFPLYVWRFKINNHEISNSLLVSELVELLKIS